MTATIHNRKLNASDLVNDQRTDNKAAVTAWLAAEPAVRSYGTGNMAACRAAFDSLPTAQEGLDALRAQIAAERRADLPIRWGDVRMMPNGVISSPDGFLRMEPRGAEALYRLATPGGAAYLSKCPADLAATNVNHWLRETAEAAEAAGEDEKSCGRIRTRVSEGGERAIFAVVSPTYGILDANKLADLASAIVTPGARADIRTDGYRTRIDIVYHAEMEGLQKGEAHKAGVRLTTADDGTGGFHIAGFALRRGCDNMCILSAEVVEGSVKGIAHRGRKDGNVDGLIGRVTAARDKAFDGVRKYPEAWAKAETETILDGDGDPRKVFEQLVKKGLVQYEGASRNEALDRLVRAWLKQGANRWNKRAVVNAMTDAAHNNRWGSGAGWGSEKLEESAGRLLYQQVRIVLN